MSRLERRGVRLPSGQDLLARHGPAQGGLYNQRVRLEALSIPAVKVLTPVRHGDRRGFVSEAYSRRALAAAGIDMEFVQDNHTLSTAAGTVRGLHFQAPPSAQEKLVRVVRGAAFAAAVDLRRGAATYGRHASVVLSARAGNQLFVPVGFAHGFMTLESDTEMLYKVSSYYAPEHDRGIRWDDPDLAIPWPLEAGSAVLSPKDSDLPAFAALDSPFSCQAGGESGRP